MYRSLSLAVLFLACACSSQSGSKNSCASSSDCEQRFASECPGGSSAFATCDDGVCKMDGCSSPIGTPCDGDPSTQFDDESCGDDGNGDPGGGECIADQECREKFRDRCPGGSSVDAICDSGTCELLGCSSPIGTPCDGDPSTIFEGEDCQ